VVIIDEAGTVPEFKLPLLLTMNAEAIVAIGDQNQLQPFSHAERDGEGQDGFFQRAVKALSGKVPMLKEQYRMHPDICELVSSLFYAKRLETNARIIDQRLALGGGIFWWDYPDMQAESPDKAKKYNTVEVDFIGAFMCDEVPGLLAQGKSVAVITFYRQQFNKLMEMGEDSGLVKTREEAKKSPVAGRFKNPNFRIVTVDAAQGSEADVVVLSCVRCNRQRNLGFINDKNRLCVALSRARERLLVVGSKTTLCHDLMWSAVATSARSY
jgi:superfamily I DNA and/or RNA helicase